MCVKIQDAIVKRIRCLCIEKKVTLNKLANLSAIPLSTLKNIMNGNSSNTGIVTIKKLCDGLDITQFFINDIFKEIE